MQRMRQNLEDAQVVFKDKSLRFTVSMGAQRSEQDMQHYDEVLFGADQAMYAAKRKGGNFCVLAD